MCAEEDENKEEMHDLVHSILFQELKKLEKEKYKNTRMEKTLKKTFI